MGEVINLSTFTSKNSPGEKNQGGELDKLLKAATIMQQGWEEMKETVAVMDFAKLKRVFETRLATIILKTKNIGADFFLCGNYVAAMLTDLGKTPPGSWYAIDYFVKAADEDNPAALKQGANICFLICAVFPLRGQFRSMKLADYEAIGKSLYYNYYGQTGIVVAYFMSRQFKPMAEITRQCFQELK